MNTVRQLTGVVHRECTSNEDVKMLTPVDGIVQKHSVPIVAFENKPSVNGLLVCI